MEKISKKRLAVGFTGPSNSGKTTLIINVANYLMNEGYKVSIVKHDPKDKAIFDKEGKDSYKFSSTGADVAVVSPTRTTLFKQETSTMEQIIDLFGDFDFLLVEGLKTIPLPRICIQRDSINENYFEVSDTIATDGSISLELFPQGMEVLMLNDLESIVNWIKKNGKEV